MENYIRKYGLVKKTGKYTPESETRRDVIAALLTEEGEIPSDMNTGQFNNLIERHYKERGLSVPASRDVHIGLERIKLRFAAQWIRHPEKRQQRSVVVAYARQMWDLLQSQFPISTNGHEQAEEIEEQAPPAPSPAVSVEELASVDPLRTLAEGHARIFSMLANEYEKLFGQIFRRLDKLENAGLANRAPPVIPQTPSDALPETTRRYFEYEFPEKTEFGLIIRYTERFRRAYKKTPAGFHWMIAKAMENLAKQGFRYPGLGFKRLSQQSKQSVLDRTGCRTYHFRVQRTWRIIVNVDNEKKIIWVEVVASHNDKMFYTS